MIPAIKTGLALGIIAPLADGGTSVSPPTANGSTLLYILAAALSGGVGSAVIGMIRSRFFASAQKANIIAETVEKTVAAAKEMMESYRVELESTRRELNEAKERITTLTEQIGGLQESLRLGRLDREKLQHDLDAALEKRARADEQMSVLQARVQTLEALVERRKVDRGRQPDRRRRNPPSS